jgi:hypothetical protein
VLFFVVVLKPNSPCFGCCCFYLFLQQNEYVSRHGMVDGRTLGGQRLRTWVLETSNEMNDLAIGEGNHVEGLRIAGGPGGEVVISERSIMWGVDRLIDAASRNDFMTFPIGDIDDVDVTPTFSNQYTNDFSSFTSGAVQREREPELSETLYTNIITTASHNDASKSSGGKQRSVPLHMQSPSSPTSSSLSPSQPEDVYEPLTPVLNMDKHQGYLHTTLAWVGEWSHDTRERLLIEKRWKMQERSSESMYRYLICHGDWRGLESWVSNLPLHDGYVDHNGVLNVEEKSSPTLAAVIPTVQASLHLLFPSMLDWLSNCLAARGIFLPSETLPECHKLMQRLCKVGRLFRSEKELTSSLSLSALLPINQPSPFHMFFAQYCINHDLPSVLQDYLDDYFLASTLASLEAMCLDMAKPWARVLLLSRLEVTHMFEVSIANSVISLVSDQQPGSNGTKQATTHHNLSDVPELSVDTMLLNCRPFMALATLMYAPVTVKQATLADPSTPFFVDQNRIITAMRTFPKLYSAFVRMGTLTDVEAGPLPWYCHIHWPRDHELTRLREPGRLSDISSLLKDIALFDLLRDAVPFELDEVLGITQTTPIDENEDNNKVVTTDTITKFDGIDGPLRHFSHPAFLPDARVVVLDVVYYLLKGRPLQAYNLLMTDREAALDAPNVDIEKFTAPFFQTSMQVIRLPSLGKSKKKNANFSITNLAYFGFCHFPMPFRPIRIGSDVN